METFGARAYRHLREFILTHRAPPSTHLKLRALAKLFNVGEMPCRIALNVLALQGLVEARPHRGFYTRTPVAEEYRALFEYNCVLASAALSKAIAGPPGRVSADVARRSIIEPFVAKTPVDPAAVARQEGELFQMIAAHSRNAIIIRSIDDINDRLFFLRMAAAPIIEGAEEELRRLELLLSSERFADLHKAVELYHARRCANVPALMRNAFGDKWAQTDETRTCARA